MAKRVRNTIAIGALLLGGATQAWAGLGDIDPTFGDGGRVTYGGLGVALLLSDDRLVVGYPGSGYTVGRFDANGKVDPTFGDGGQTYLRLPAKWPLFYAWYSTATPDGGLLFAGTLHSSEAPLGFEVVVRLDGDGHVVTSFGGRGDGFYRLTDVPLRELEGGTPTMLTAIALDAAGRILLAKRGWTSDGRCSGPTGVIRLTPTGTPDVAFGRNGRADVRGIDLCGGAALFGARADGSIVIGARGTIVGLDSSGALDATFGQGGHVSHGAPDDWGRGRLLPDGGILTVEHSPLTMEDPRTTNPNHTVLTKFDRNGQPDAAFGAGTGSVWVDLAAAFVGIYGPHQLVHDFVLAPDGAHLYLHLAVIHPEGTAACAGGIARISLDGTPDNSFGNKGLTCLDYGAFPFFLLASQRSGSPLFGRLNGSLHRLLPDATPSPGMLTMARTPPASWIDVGEADGTVAVRVVRTAGHDGAVSASLATGSQLTPDDGIGNPIASDAMQDDFEAVSERLDWADGDESERGIAVTILDDEFEEPPERFSVLIVDPQGGVLQLGTGGVDVEIHDDDTPPLTPPPPMSPPMTVDRSDGGGSGGGSLTWANLLVVSALLLARRRDPYVRRARSLSKSLRHRWMRPITHAAAPGRGEDRGRQRLLANIIALLSAIFVLTVFGIGRMPSRLTDRGSAASTPERPHGATPSVATTESAAPAG